MADFLMPSLGADMETGTLVQWLVAPGARVRPGDVVAVVETHKGAIDVECFLDGVIEDLAPVGQALPVGAVLAHVRAAGESSPASPAAPVTSPVTAPAAGTVAATVAATVMAPATQAPATGAATASSRRAVSPAARRRARELGVDVASVIGSGPEGVVTWADVERASAEGAPAAPAEAGAVPRPVPPRAGFDATSMRQAIAAAMSRSKREIPHYYLDSTVDFGPAQDWLQAWNREREPADALLPAALLLKAVAVALRAVPGLNGRYANQAFQASDRIHVGWAVALRGGGLVAPAVHDADLLPLPALMAALRDLVQRARTGGLRSSELTDPTVTVTSLGDRGAERVLGVIHPPQVAIIGFGRIVERPWVVAGRVLPRPVVALSLAADHRVSDGHDGGRLLAAIEAALQRPDQL